ncbi:MAG: HAD family phosphatase [Muribaculaceae bacterium]|nr:HAD family phosphatase [Muribaculaceae bacterium]
MNNIEISAPEREQSRVNPKTSFGILFDLDGVLVDSEREYTRIWNQIEQEYPTGIEDFARKIKGTNLNDILSRHYPDPAIRAKVEQRLYELEGQMKYDYCPGAENVLKKLKSAGFPIALYTSSNHVKMEHLYRDIPEIREYFDYIVLGDMVKESKPSPEGYLKAAEGIGLTAGQWIVVEDSLQGVKAGKASGGKVIGVAGTLPAEVLAPYSDVVIDSMSDFPDVNMIMTR